MSEQPYVKITIIIEDDDRIVTVRVPKAQNVSLDTKAVPVLNLGDLGSSRYATDIGDLNLSLRALFSDTHQHLFVAETSIKAKTT